MKCAPPMSYQPGTASSGTTGLLRGNHTLAITLHVITCYIHSRKGDSDKVVINLLVYFGRDVILPLLKQEDELVQIKP